MKTKRQLTERFLELQEHPEQMTDEQLQQALDDPKMHELVEQMAFAKRAFKNEELKTAEPDVEGEWERFATKNFDEGNETQHGYPFKKIAASFIGILLVSGMAFAATHHISHPRYYLLTPSRPTRRPPSNPSYSTTCRWRRC